MIQFFKNLFKAKEPGPVATAPYKVETPTAKVEAVNAQPVAKKITEKAVQSVPAKKRTFVKREDSGTAKVAKVKEPAKPRAAKSPKAK